MGGSKVAETDGFRCRAYSSICKKVVGANSKQLDNKILIQLITYSAAAGWYLQKRGHLFFIWGDELCDRLATKFGEVLGYATQHLGSSDKHNSLGHFIVSPPSLLPAKQHAYAAQL